MRLSIIAAVANNNALGKDNSLPWRLPGDLRYFKELTYGKTIIMGRKTFESLPGILPNRRHIVVTRNTGYAPGVETAHSLEDAIAKASPEGDAFIIGGGSIYRAALPLCERIYITEIYADYDADVFFPEFDKSAYELTERSEVFTENGISYRFLCYNLIDNSHRSCARR